MMLLPAREEVLSFCFTDLLVWVRLSLRRPLLSYCIIPFTGLASSFIFFLKKNKNGLYAITCSDSKNGGGTCVQTACLLGSLARQQQSWKRNWLTSWSLLEFGVLSCSLMRLMYVNRSTFIYFINISCCHFKNYLFKMCSVSHDFLDLLGIKVWFGRFEKCHGGRLPAQTGVPPRSALLDNKQVTQCSAYGLPESADVSILIYIYIVIANIYYNFLSFGNRVKCFDPAFNSRINVAIKYNDLDTAARQKGI